MSKGRLIVAGAVLALVAHLAGCSPDDGGEAQAPVEREALPVEVEAVVPGLAGAIEASGLVAYLRETPLSFAAAGRIVDVMADEGDTVRSGQLLARLQRTTSGADDREAAAARRTAEQDVERTRRLFERGFASRAALDRAELALEKARDDLELTAPAAGVVLRRQIERGQVVAPGASVFVVGEVGSGLVVRAPLSAREAAAVRSGLAADVRVRGRDVMKGEILRVAAKSDELTGLFEVEVAIRTSERLRSGEIADISIAAGPTAGEVGAVVIPAIALTNARADQGEVFVVVDGRARRRAVETAGVSSLGVSVLSGLAPGDLLITRGAARLKDGDPVIAVKP
jgi:RND family efflux transporter MFP subunit